MYPNIEEDNTELAQLNAEIEKVKAMLAERQSKYEDVPQPKTQVGWSSYIVDNDRGMLDKYQDAERQWYNLKEQERHASELADKQRAQQDAYNMDEIEKNRTIAHTKYQYAVAARKNYTDGNQDVERQLEQAEAEAKADLDYWNKRAGRKVTIENVDNDNKPKTQDVSVLITDLKSITSFGTEAEKNDKLNEISAHPSFNKNPELKDQYNRLKKIVSKESANASRANKLAAAQAEYDKLRNSLERDSFMSKHPNYIIVEGKLQYK